MPIEITCYKNYDDILLWNFTGHWTSSEFEQAREFARDYVKNYNGVVDALVDLTDSVLIPQNMIARADLWATHPIATTGTISVITQNLLMRMFYTTVTRTFYKQLVDEQRIFLVPNIEEALHLILTKREKFRHADSLS